MTKRFYSLLLLLTASICVTAQRDVYVSTSFHEPLDDHQPL